MSPVTRLPINRRCTNRSGMTWTTTYRTNTFAANYGSRCPTTATQSTCLFNTYDSLSVLTMWPINAINAINACRIRARTAAPAPPQTPTIPCAIVPLAGQETGVSCLIDATQIRAVTPMRHAFKYRSRPICQQFWPSAPPIACVRRFVCASRSRLPAAANTFMRRANTRFRQRASQAPILSSGPTRSAPHQSVVRFWSTTPIRSHAAIEF